MKSKDNNQPLHNINMPLSQRRLKTKPTLIVLAVLLLGNIFWFILWLLPSNDNSPKEEVATIDGEVITRQQWLAEMETLYGKETLQNLVNQAVMEKAAKEYKIKVTDDEIEFEIALLRSAQDVNDTSLQTLSDEQLREKLRYQLILEKVLTKDLVVDDKDVKSYYDDNQSLYNVPTTYRTNLIVVETKEEANAVTEELKNGSEFAVVAREKSVDLTSASLGGAIGFVSAEQSNMDSSIISTVKKAKVNEITEPFAMSDGKYGIVLVEEVIEGQSFTYKEAKDHIKRQIALQELPSSVNPEAFWSEFNATWFYGEGN